MVSTVDASAVGLGENILYQSYFVCLKETFKSTVIEYGKSQGTTEVGDVYLTMIDIDKPLFVRFYSFGNGEKPMEVVDAHIISRHLTKANCKGDTVLDKETNMCVQNCHELCDPTRGTKLHFTIILLSAISWHSSTIERFHMTSRRPYWCTKTMKRRPLLVCQANPVGVEVFPYVNTFFCSNNLHSCWSRV